MEPVTFRLVAQCLNHLRHRLPQNTEVRHIKSTKLCYHLEDLLTYLLTYSTVQSRSWEANWFAASQEIPRISRNPKVHYRTHKPPQPV